MLNCLNGGKCLIRKLKYECECPSGFTGFLCNETTESIFNHQKNIENYKNKKFQGTILLNSLVDMVRPFDYKIETIINNKNNMNKQNMKQTSKPLETFSMLDKLKKYLNQFRLLQSTPELTHQLNYVNLTHKIFSSSLVNESPYYDYYYDYD
jgi:hypothetical protein